MTLWVDLRYPRNGIIYIKKIISSQSVDQDLCLQITSDQRLAFWHCNKNSQDTEGSDHICDDHCICAIVIMITVITVILMTMTMISVSMIDHQSLGTKVLPPG